ncbi:MAG: hypothetical protein HY308_07370 [Gammaproteobacteria bacterium]|nr:hypothetical protein [Gammaproteobacteria bacterium]
MFLKAPGSGNDGSVEISAVADAWLLYDWDGDGAHDDSPSGRATFGIFKRQPAADLSSRTVLNQ